MAQTDIILPDMTHAEKLQSSLPNPNTGFEDASEGAWSTPPSSPTTSCSASEDNQISDAADKPLPDIPLLDATPSATPFIPLLLHSLLRPVRDMTTLQPQIPKWLRTFQRATLPNFDLSYNALALILVQADPWMAETMAELSREISWTAAESSPEDLQTVITVAGLIHKQFREMRGPHFANCFLWNLEETLLSTFLSVWDAVGVLIFCHCVMQLTKGIRCFIDRIIMTWRYRTSRGLLRNTSFLPLASASSSQNYTGAS